MLISFSVSNYRSFFEEQTLSMVANKKHTGHEWHLTQLPGQEESILPAAVIYGANGAGKSNLVRALRFVERLVVQGTEAKENIGLQRFSLDPQAEQRPAEFEIRYLHRDVVFTLGFRLTDKVIASEWLSMLSGNREVSLYERVTDESGSVVVEAGDPLKDTQSGDHSKILAMATVGARANQLFLTAIRESVDASNRGPLIDAAIDWFDSVLFIIRPDSNFSDLVSWLAEKEDFAAFTSNFLREASTGVAGIHASKVEVPPTEMALFPNHIREALRNRKASRKRPVAVGRDGARIFFEEGAANATLELIQAVHTRSDGEPVLMQFEQESDGTKRLVHLLPAIYKGQGKNHVFVIDELDRSLHPLLSRKFVEFFMKACGGKHSQLVVTTHESNLMDLDILRRDELWFAEKDARSATTLYSLADFQVRKDLRIDRGYLQGRFGAIPFLSNIDRLCTPENAPSK